MRILVLLITICISSISFGQVPSYVPSNGLVGWWPFNGNANDESGNGYDGTVNGASLASDRFGNPNSAYDFDGIDDHIIVNNIITNYSEYTFSSWFRVYTPSLTSTLTGIVSQTGNASGAAGGTIQSLSHGYTHTDSILCTHRMANQTLSSVISDTNDIYNWNHIVSVWDGTNVLFYLNGQLQGTVAVNGLTVMQPELYFGAMRWLGIVNRFLDGSVDDVSIHDRALTACEIQDLYNAGVNSIASVTQTDVTLTADQNNATYQWIDCDNNNSPISGETNQSYTPTVTGNYAVEVTVNGCTYVSECVLVDFTGVDELLNPTMKKLVKIVNLLGQEVAYTPNTVLIYQYSDGTSEKVFTVED